MIALVLVAVFAGTMLLVMAAYTLVNRRRLAAGDTLRERLAPGMAEGAIGATILKIGGPARLRRSTDFFRGKV